MEGFKSLPILTRHKKDTAPPIPHPSPRVTVGTRRANESWRRLSIGEKKERRFIPKNLIPKPKPWYGRGAKSAHESWWGLHRQSEKLLQVSKQIRGRSTAALLMHAGSKEARPPPPQPPPLVPVAHITRSDRTAPNRPPYECTQRARRQAPPPPDPLAHSTSTAATTTTTLLKAHRPDRCGCSSA